MSDKGITFSAQDSNLEQGNSSHWEQTSSFLFLTQQVMWPQEGCFSKKSGPAHPGHLELPACGTSDTARSRYRNSRWWGMP